MANINSLTNKNYQQALVKRPKKKILDQGYESQDPSRLRMRSL